MRQPTLDDTYRALVAVGDTYRKPNAPAVAAMMGCSETQAKTRLAALVAAGRATVETRKRYDAQAPAMMGCQSGLFGGAGSMIRRFKVYRAVVQ